MMHSFEVRAYFNPRSKVEDVTAFLHSFRVKITRLHTGPHQKGSIVLAEGPAWWLPQTIESEALDHRDLQVEIHELENPDLEHNPKARHPFYVNDPLVFEVACTSEEGCVYVLLTKEYKPNHPICPACKDPLLPDEDHTYAPFHVSCHWGD